MIVFIICGVISLNKKQGFQLKELIIIVILTSIITSLTTGVIMYNNSRITSHVSGNDLSNDDNLKEFLKVYASLIGDYYTDIDKKAMLEEAMKAMFEYLGEDYTNYLNQTETNALAEKLLGEYKGIGVQIIDHNIIYKVFDDSPAKDSGLLAGDQIVAVNGTDVQEKSSTEVASMIQAVSEGNIIIQVLRNEVPLEFSVEVKTLMVPAVYSQMINEGDCNIGYLAISTFSDTVATQFRKSLEGLEKQNLSSLIIDLRGNTGGYLSSATEIASMFLEEGKVIYSLADRNETKEYKDETEEQRRYPIVILMNDGTASASEILAAALKDSYGATLVGETSYGKGKVQQTKTLEDGSMVKYTTARWIRPNGDCIDGIGLHPDIEVDLLLPDDGSEVVDTQLKEAIQILKEK